MLAALDAMLGASIDVYLLLSLSGTTADDADLMAMVDRSGRQPPVPAGTYYLRDRDLPPIPLDTPVTLFTAQDLRAATWTFQPVAGVQSLVALPLISQGRPIALLLLASYDHDFTVAEMAPYTSLASLLAITLATITAREAVAAQTRRVESLYAASETINAQTQTAQVLSIVTELLVEPVGYRNAWIGMIDPQRTRIQGRSGAGVLLTPELIRVEHALDGESVPALVARTGIPEVRDALKQGRAEGWEAHALAVDLRHSITVPLRTQQNVIGILGVGSASRQVEADEVALLAAFANQVATTLERLEATAIQGEQLVKLKAAYEQQESLLGTIRDLATPVLPVYEGIIILPLIGHLDTNRSMQIMDVLLGAIHRDRAHVAIMDITGVPVIDTSVANHLIQATRAAALLGTTCVLVGITPEVAQTMVQLGIDMGSLRTQSNLQTALLTAMQQQGMRMHGGRMVA
ncbi:MAG TPA: GAF domain-containing protein [Herpetosiphonaceae bacterium]|nr:GAF domain-containing protein [Herpetosiphonaceae bacterium]